MVLYVRNQQHRRTQGTSVGVQTRRWTHTLHLLSCPQASPRRHDHGPRDGPSANRVHLKKSSFSSLFLLFMSLSCHSLLHFKNPISTEACRVPSLHRAPDFSLPKPESIFVFLTLQSSPWKPRSFSKAERPFWEPLSSEAISPWITQASLEVSFNGCFQISIKSK